MVNVPLLEEKKAQEIEASPGFKKEEKKIEHGKGYRKLQYTVSSLVAKLHSAAASKKEKEEAALKLDNMIADFQENGMMVE